MSADDLVIEQFADRVVELEERLRLMETYRAIALAAIEQLAERNRELEAARRRIVALIGELRALKDVETA